MTAKRVKLHIPVAGVAAKLIVILVGLAFGLVTRAFPSILQAGLTGAMLLLALAVATVWQLRADHPTRTYMGVVATLCAASFAIPAVVLGTATAPLLLAALVTAVSLTYAM